MPCNQPAPAKGTKEPLGWIERERGLPKTRRKPCKKLQGVANGVAVENGERASLSCAMVAFAVCRLTPLTLMESRGQNGFATGVPGDRKRGEHAPWRAAALLPMAEKRVAGWIPGRIAGFPPSLSGRRKT